MKSFLKLVTIALAIVSLSSCNKDGGEVSKPQAVSFETLINNELSLYENDKYVDTKSVRKALISFDQSLVFAQKSLLRDNVEIGDRFISQAKENGLKIDSNLDKPILMSAVPAIPTELLDILRQFAETTDVNSIDQYIKNLSAFEKVVRQSNLKFVEKMTILGCVITVKIIAKIAKFFNAQTANEKWVKGLKCAFKSLTSGLSGALSGCSEGTTVVGDIGALGGTQGRSIGSLVGCVIGGVIKGIIHIAETAEECVEAEGL